MSPDTALNSFPQALSLTAFSHLPEPGGEPEEEVGACFTCCSQTVTPRDRKSVSCAAWWRPDPPPPRSAPSPLGPVGERNEVCGLEKEKEAEAPAANVSAVECFNSMGICWPALGQNFYGDNLCLVSVIIHSSKRGTLVPFAISEPGRASAHSMWAARNTWAVSLGPGPGLDTRR